MSGEQPARIVVLGGGFAGIYAVMELERLRGRDPRVEITLRLERNVALDWTLDLLFTKDLVQCPTARGMPVGVAPEAIAAAPAVRAAS